VLKHTPALGQRARKATWLGGASNWQQLIPLVVFAFGSRGNQTPRRPARTPRRVRRFGSRGNRTPRRPARTARPARLLPLGKQTPVPGSTPLIASAGFRRLDEVAGSWSTSWRGYRRSSISAVKAAMRRNRPRNIIYSIWAEGITCSARTLRGHARLQAVPKPACGFSTAPHSRLDL
jgi:hypothetical protein